MFTLRRTLRRKLALAFTMFIPTRKLRRDIRRKITGYGKEVDYSHKMRLGVTYSVWDGEELLESSLKSIRKNVDYINVVWQKHSWEGAPCSESLESLLKDLKGRGLLDHYIQYVPKRTTAARNEKIKRQVGVDDLKENKCSHFLIMDVDEFYVEDELRRAKSYIVENGIEHSACGIYNYEIKPTYRCVDVAPLSVQFISILNDSTELGTHDRYCIIDPTRISGFKGLKCYYFTTIQMHHMRTVRKDLESKFRNSSAHQNNSDDLMAEYEDISKVTEKNFREHGLVEVENLFKITF